MLNAQIPRSCWILFELKLVWDVGNGWRDHEHVSLTSPPVTKSIKLPASLDRPLSASTVTRTCGRVRMMYANGWEVRTSNVGQATLLAAHARTSFPDIDPRHERIAAVALSPNTAGIAGRSPPSSSLSKRLFIPPCLSFHFLLFLD